ncbi:MAG: hypothetical protein Q9227_005310 [Pyrenula ochraceoflavens]
MRDEKSSNASSNGFTSLSNGSSPDSARKAAKVGVTNGHAHSEPQANGTNGTNGTKVASLPKFSSTYRGHNREEVTRILIQGLADLGYDTAAKALSSESGYKLESGAVGDFRQAILEGEWLEAERILSRSRVEGSEADFSEYTEGDSTGLVLAEGADKNQMLFWLRQQKFLELLEQRDLAEALRVLRTELTPLNHDINQLHALSSLLMCPAEDLQSQAQWEGTALHSREALLSELNKSVSPSVMIPSHRLATLLDQVKQSQINRCLYHNTAAVPSLYSDHLCSRANFPLKTMLELDSHTDEVWMVQFSNDGLKLATAGRDGSVLIWDAIDFRILHKLTNHDGSVSYVSWSPDDTKLITCSKDKKARLFDIESGRCLITLDHRDEPVTTATWAPDGLSFVTGSLDLEFNMAHWKVSGENLHIWKAGVRIQDCAITPDGQRIVAISCDKKLCVFNFQTRAEEYRISFPVELTSVIVTADSRYMLISTSGNEIQLLDIQTTDVVRRYQGQQQGKFVIRSTLGGAAENFVVSGSEDSYIYVWHKENGQLVEALRGDDLGCVNAVSWNPHNPGMFASAGDDKKVRIWSNRVDATESSPSSPGPVFPGMRSARTSAVRSTFWGGDVGNL